jgi:hypothetical protein
VLKSLLDNKLHTILQRKSNICLTNDLTNHVNLHVLILQYL